MFDLNKNDYRLKKGDIVFRHVPGRRLFAASLIYNPNSRNKYAVLLGMGALEISDEIERTIKRCRFVINENKSNLFHVGDVVINSPGDNYFSGRGVIVGIVAERSPHNDINYVVRVFEDILVIVPADHIELYEG